MRDKLDTKEIVLAQLLKIRDRLDLSEPYVRVEFRNGRDVRVHPNTESFAQFPLLSMNFSNQLVVDIVEEILFDETT